jgi:hypothetical protein
MPRPKKTKAPPKRVWITFDVRGMHPIQAWEEEPKDVDVFDDEVVYRYDFHVVKK